MSEQAEITLESLVGEHLLSGVDFDTTRVAGKDEFEAAQVINFTLDGITYTAIEDPEDGYRSCMKSLLKSESPTDNHFAPVRVLASMAPTGGDGTNVLELREMRMGKVVLRVGTENSSDYYPSFVAQFTPENLTAVNQDEPKGK